MRRVLISALRIHKAVWQFIGGVSPYNRKYVNEDRFSAIKPLLLRMACHGDYKWS